MTDFKGLGLAVEQSSRTEVSYQRLRGGVFLHADWDGYGRKGCAMMSIARGQLSAVSYQWLRGDFILWHADWTDFKRRLARLQVCTLLATDS